MVEDRDEEDLALQPQSVEEKKALHLPHHHKISSAKEEMGGAMVVDETTVDHKVRTMVLEMITTKTRETGVMEGVVAIGITEGVRDAESIKDNFYFYTIICEFHLKARKTNLFNFTATAYVREMIFSFTCQRFNSFAIRSR